MQRSVVCARCRGAKELYRSALGDAAPSEFRLAELIQLVAQALIKKIVCTACAGRGTVDIEIPG